MDNKLKILFVGPEKSGKSTLVNFLSGFRENPTSRYYATNPLRIIETEIELEANKLYGGKNKKNTERRVVFAGSDAKVKKVLIQLWDVSGNTNNNQAGWPAIAQDADGIVFVFNPDDIEHCSSEKELLLWYKQFALNQNDIDANGNVMQRVQDSHCLIMAHHSTAPVSDSAAAMQSSLQIPKNLSKVKIIESSLEFRSDNFKEAFDQLIEQIMIDKLNKEDAVDEKN